MLSKAVTELENKLKTLSDTSYDSIDRLMRKIMKKYQVTAKELHNGFKKKHQKTPDDWIHQMKNQKDEEGQMARSELSTMKRKIKELESVIKSDDQQLPAWVQSKITRANDYLTAAADFMQSDGSLDENISFSINKPEHSEIQRRQTKIEKAKNLSKQATTSGEQQAANKAIERLQKGPKLGEETRLVDKILKEMGCECQKEKENIVYNPAQIAKKHKVSIKEIESQLKAGIKVEMEHTDDKEEAEKIALDHLNERPDYYTRLKKVEMGEESNILRDIFGNVSYEFIDLIKPDPIQEEKKKKGTLHHWFKGSESDEGKPGWVQADGSPCANEEGEKSTPKCFSSDRLKELESKGEEGEKIIKSAVRRKRQKDKGQQQKSGGAKPTNVPTFAKGKKDPDYVKAEPSLSEQIIAEAKKDIPGKGSGKKDACYHKVRAKYDVWPSAYASGALVQCRKKGADNWGEEVEEQRYCKKCKKMETRDECSYGPETWDKMSVKMNEAVIQSQNGQNLTVTLNWRGAFYTMQMFFPQIKIPTKLQVQDAIEKVYPGAKLVLYKVSTIQTNQPIIQIPSERSRKYITLNNEEIEIEEDWQSVNKKDKTDGMSSAAVKAYRRENPGSKLQTAVTEKKPKGKRAKRRKSFCRRSKGQMNMHNIDCSKTPDKPICKARRRWNCE
jgi:hypothetical protein